MGVAGLGEISDQGLGRVPVAESGSPRPEVELVRRHRLGQDVAAGAGGHPLLVAPAVRAFGHDGAGRRRNLGTLGHRIGLENPAAVAREDLVLVDRAGSEPGHEQLPDTAGAEAAQRVPLAVPRVEVADHANRARIRSPHGERHTADAVVMTHVRAECLPELLVPTLRDQVAVDVAQGRKVTVGIVDAVVGTAVVGGHQLVRPRLCRAFALPDSSAHVIERDLGAVVRDGRHRRRHRPTCTDDPRSIGALMRTEDVVRGVIRTRRDRVEDLVRDIAHRVSFTCRM